MSFTLLCRYITTRTNFSILRDSIISLTKLRNNNITYTMWTYWCGLSWNKQNELSHHTRYLLCVYWKQYFLPPTLMTRSGVAIIFRMRWSVFVKKHFFTGTSYDNIFRTVTERTSRQRGGARCGRVDMVTVHVVAGSVTGDFPLWGRNLG